MNKYAFIQNVPGLSVQPYELSFDDGEWLSHVAGFDGIDKCMDYAKKLAAEGMEGIELCGSFDLDMTKAVIAAVESVNPKIPVGSNGIDV